MNKYNKVSATNVCNAYDVFAAPWGLLFNLVSIYLLIFNLFIIFIFHLFFYFARKAFGAHFVFILCCISYLVCFETEICFL